VNRSVATDTTTPAALRQGFVYGALGVVIFAMTLPMTRLAVGDTSAPQLSPAFVTAGRAALAGLLSALYLGLGRVPLPPRAVWPALVVASMGTVAGFPLFLALALREVPAMHAAVVTGVLPLGTAVVAALVLRQRPSRGFWVCAALGAGLVLAFALRESGGVVTRADGYLLLAVLCTAVAYVAGARAAQVVSAPHAICWCLILALPFTVPLALWWWPGWASASAWAWGGFVYLGVFSMWLGFFAWYHGLAVGGVVRVSQVQLLQPFLALLFAVPVLGEPLEPVTVAFALAVLAVVWLGRRMPVGAPATKP
jgi:drug/metabolite transporter (DMT)-like permease